jgi:hypothetical protein
MNINLDILTQMLPQAKSHTDYSIVIYLFVQLPTSKPSLCTFEEKWHTEEAVGK